MVVVSETGTQGPRLALKSFAGLGIGLGELTGDHMELTMKARELRRVRGSRSNAGIVQYL